MKKLLIDLEKIEGHLEKCGVKCDYYYHPANNGLLSLQEMATYAVVCRRCEKPNCVTSCPFQALEKGPDGILRRYNMRCTSCKTCAHACHSGVIWPTFIPYMFHNCDYCLERLKGGDAPACVKGCSCEAVRYGDLAEDKGNHMYAAGDRVIVRAARWERDEVKT